MNQTPASQLPGQVIAVNYNGTYYYYLRNAQGDVVKLIDKTGSTVVEYTYDSWGKLLSTTGSLAETFGAEQPFRYRGYVYDEETGFYYLQSRYYNPEVGRFISADVYLSTGQGVLGHNAYAYCLNNPAIMVDYTGNDGELIEIGKGWFVRIDAARNGGKRHIHIWNKRDDSSFSQNDDGSPHDKGNNKQGKLPKWLQKAVKEKADWDYNGNRDRFYRETSVTKENGIYTYHFADGTEIQRLSKPLFDTIRSKEKIYCEGSNIIVPIYNGFQSIPVLPLIGEFGFILPSFGFGFGFIPLFI